MTAGPFSPPFSIPSRVLRLSLDICRAEPWHCEHRWSTARASTSETCFCARSRGLNITVEQASAANAANSNVYRSRFPPDIPLLILCPLALLRLLKIHSEFQANSKQ